MIDNPDYKGEWKAPMIDNPDYKGPWEHPLIPNKDYAPETYAKYKDLTTVGFELWTVNGGSIFDNILVTDDKKYADKMAEKTWKKIKGEEDAKEMAKKSAASKRATVATTKKKKPANDTKTTEQTTAPAPAKMKDAPVTTPTE